MGADLSGRWAFAATQAGRLPEAEEALEKKQHLGEMASSMEVQLDALQALAVVRRKRQNEPGVKAVLTAVERLTGDTGQVAEVLKKLRRVAPPVTATNCEAIRTKSDTVQVSDEEETEGDAQL